MQSTEGVGQKDSKGQPLGNTRTEAGMSAVRQKHIDAVTRDGYKRLGRGAVNTDSGAGRITWK